MKHIGRWAGLGALLLSAVVIPGGLRLAADRAPVERPMAQGSGAIASLVDLPVDPPTTTSTSPVPPPPDDVPISSPDTFTGPVAAPAGLVHGFAGGASATAFGEVFALVIGIDDYPGRRHDLSSAGADAGLVDEALERFGVPNGNRMVLRDGQATREAVASATADLARQGGPGSTLVFAYAGHVRKLDRNTEAMVLADGGLLTDVELAELLAPARHRMWILMATCFAGGFTEVLAPGRVLTGASGANQLAYENRSLGASYLVHYLVREGWLQGEAGPSVQEAFDYASAALAREHPNRMPVQINPDGTDIRFRSASAAPPPSATTTADRPPDEPQGSTPTSTTTTEPDRRCLVLFRCKD